MILYVLIPSYFPSISECARLVMADIIVIADTFKFNKHSPSHRTSIKTSNGKHWLTIPVLGNRENNQKISEKGIDARQPWTTKHWRTIQLNYNNSPYFYWFADALEEFYRKNRHAQWLLPLLMQTIEFCFSYIACKAQVVFASTLDHAFADRSDRVLAWMKAHQCDTYLIPQHQLALLNVEKIKAAGKKIMATNYIPIPYHQQFSGFVADLCVLDLLFNEGTEGISNLKNSIQYNLI